MLDEQQESQQATPAAEDSDGQDPTPAPPEPSETERLKAECERLTAEKAELLAKFQRAQAEFENARKRLVREQEEVREYAAVETVSALLPVLDDFERALEAPGVDPEYRKGLELIRDRIVEAFQRAGLRPIDEDGLFDPHLHQAVDRAPAESDQEDQQILEVYRRGYRFKDRVLRASLVKVAVKE